MTTINTTDSPGADYTWDSADFTWDDLRSESKSWAEANVANFVTTVDESLSFSELLGNTYGKNLAEALGLSDANANQVSKALAESLGISESYIDYIAYVLRVMESMSLSDGLAFTQTLPIQESLAISDAISKSFTLSKNEYVLFAEVFGRVVGYKKSISEGLGISDALAKATTLNKTESLTLFEEYVRRANSVISDMIIGSGDLTLAEFKNIVDAGHAPGYSSFRDFSQGDYEYRYAIFRTVLESVNSYRARLTTLKVDVDVPDVYDRGGAVITNASTGLLILFNRTFHIVPEITVTLTGGTVVAIPDVVSKDLQGFTVVLTNLSNQRVTGTISWSAHGY